MIISKGTSRIALTGWLFLPQNGSSNFHLSALKHYSWRILFLLLLTCKTTQSGAMVLSVDSNQPTAGYFQLSWDAHSEIQLIESPDAEFSTYKVIYTGKDNARFMSGKPDGDYYYRIWQADNNQNHSNDLKVSVKHHSLVTAVSFFVAGAIVFISVLLLIVSGNKRYKGA